VENLQVKDITQGVLLMVKGIFTEQVDYHCILSELLVFVPLFTLASVVTDVKEEKGQAQGRASSGRETF